MSALISNRPLFRPDVVAVWCERHAHEHRRASGEIDLAALVNKCAWAFRVTWPGGPLEDPRHWMWHTARATIDRAQATCNQPEKVRSDNANQSR